jgi:hypothetical protein
MGINLLQQLTDQFNAIVSPYKAKKVTPLIPNPKATLTITPKPIVPTAPVLQSATKAPIPMPTAKPNLMTPFQSSATMTPTVKPTTTTQSFTAKDLIKAGVNKNLATRFEDMMKGLKDLGVNEIKDISYGLVNSQDIEHQAKGTGFGLAAGQFYGGMGAGGVGEATVQTGRMAVNLLKGLGTSVATTAGFAGAEKIAGEDPSISGLAPIAALSFALGSIGIKSNPKELNSLISKVKEATTMDEWITKISKEEKAVVEGIIKDKKNPINSMEKFYTTVKGESTKPNASQAGLYDTGKVINLNDTLKNSTSAEEFNKQLKGKTFRVSVDELTPSMGEAASHRGTNTQSYSRGAIEISAPPYHTGRTTWTVDNGNHRLREAIARGEKTIEVKLSSGFDSATADHWKILNGTHTNKGGYLTPVESPLSQPVGGIPKGGFSSLTATPEQQSALLKIAKQGTGEFKVGDIYTQKVAAGQTRPVIISKVNPDGSVEGFYAGSISPTERGFGIDPNSLQSAKWNNPKTELQVPVGGMGGVKKDLIIPFKPTNNFTKNLKPLDSPEQKKLAQYVVDNYDSLKKKYFDRVEQKFGTRNFVSADEVKYILPDFTAEKSVLYHPISSAFSKAIYEDLLKEVPKGKIGMMSGATGVGKTSSLRNIGNEIKDYSIVYDTNLSGKSAKIKVQKGLDAGHSIEITHIHRDPIVAFEKGVIPRVKSQGRLVSIEEHIKRHDESFPTLTELKKIFGDKIKIKIIDNTGNTPQEAKIVSFDNFIRKEYDKNELSKILYEKTNEAYKQGKLTEKEYQEIIRRSSFAGTPQNKDLVKSFEASKQTTIGSTSRQTTKGINNSGKQVNEGKIRTTEEKSLLTPFKKVEQTSKQNKPAEKVVEKPQIKLTEQEQKAPEKSVSNAKIQLKSSSSKAIISQPVKQFEKKPQELNVNRLNLTNEEKANVVSLEGKEVRQKLGDKQILKIARDAGLDTKTYTIDETAQKIAEQLNVRRNVVSLEKQLSQTTDIIEREKILRKIAEQSRISRTQGTDVARQLAARRIIANELDSPIQRIFKLLEEAGVNPEVYLKKAKTVNFNNVNEVVNFYRDLVPAKFNDWLDAFRYNSMLSSPRTHIVNIFSNLLNVGVVAPIEKTLTGGIDFFSHAITGGQREHFVGEGAVFAKGSLSNLKGAVNRAIEVMQGKSQITNLDTFRPPIATKGFKGFMAKSLDVPMKALEAADQFFMALTEGGSEAALRYRQSKGGKITGDIKIMAQEEARYRLYRQALNSPNEGALLKAIDFIPKKIMQARNSKNPVIRLVGRFTFPFIATPTNIAKQGLEYSPAGLFTAFGAKSSKEQISKTILGTLATAGAAMLLGSGRLTWAEPVDPDQKTAFRAAGKLPYAIKIGDKWVSYTNLPPAISANLAIISSLDNALKNKKLNETWVDAIMKSITSYGNFFADKSYFKQMGDMLAAVKGDPSAWSSYLSNFPQQVIPLRAFSGWIARMTDAYQRKVDYNSGFINTQVQLLMANIPYFNQQLNLRIDAEGDAVRNQYQYLNSLSPLQFSKELPEKLPQLEESFGGLPLYKFLKTIDKSKANAYVDSLFERKPELYSKLKKFKAIDTVGLGEAEYAMIGSGIKDGTRAGLVVTQLNNLNTKTEKNNYIQKLYDLGIITDDVLTQLRTLKEQGKLSAVGNTIVKDSYEHSPEAPKNLIEKFQLAAKGIEVGDWQNTVKAIFTQERMRRISGNALIFERKTDLNTKHNGMVVDHIVPLGLGGDNSAENTRYITPQANSAKAKLETELIKKLKAGTITKEEARRQVKAWVDKYEVKKSGSLLTPFMPKA